MHDPLQPHSHDPNPAPPSADAAILLQLPEQAGKRLQPDALLDMPRTELKGQMILSTGHPSTGPFDFAGVTLLDLLRSQMTVAVANFTIEVVSGDGFGTRIQGSELFAPDPAGPIMLIDTIDGQLMSRAQGLVRLIVPSEKDDALRQVKWIAEIRVKWHDQE